MRDSEAFRRKSGAAVREAKKQNYRADCRVENGEANRFRDSGTHAELMAQNGKYREMFLKQAEGYLKA